MPQAMKIPDANAAVENNGKTFEKIPAWQLTKVRNKNEVIADARNEGRTVHMVSLMDLCHLKNSELEPQFQKYKGRVVLRGDICEGRFRIVCCIYWAGIISITNDRCKSHGYYIKTTGMRRTSSRRSIRIHLGQNGRCSQRYSKFQSQSAQIFGYVYQSTNGPNLGPVWKIQSFLLNEICTVILWQDDYGKGNSRKFFENTVAIKFQIGYVHSLTDKKDYSCLCMWTT